MSKNEFVEVSLDECYNLAFAALMDHGCNTENAEAAAEFIMLAERDGGSSHGLFRLPGYVASLKSGKLKGNANPQASHLTPCLIRIDGDLGMAPLAIQRGLPHLAQAARQYGLAALSLVDIYHFSALWIEVEKLAHQGFCGLALTANTPFVAPAGSSKAFFGTNPIAFSWPRQGKEPAVFDQSASVMARGDLMIAARDGRKVPMDVGVDSEGQRTDDPAKIIEGGAQLAFGGYKGSNLALMVELLAGPLIGELCSYEAEEIENKDGGPPKGGELILAFDPAKFRPEGGTDEHTERFFNKLLGLPGTRLPGDRRRQHRENSPGVTKIPARLLQTIRALVNK